MKLADRLRDPDSRSLRENFDDMEEASDRIEQLEAALAVAKDVLECTPKSNCDCKDDAEWCPNNKVRHALAKINEALNTN